MGENDSMVARKELIDAGMLACRRRMESLGFTKHHWAFYMLPLDRHLLGWAALSRAVNRYDGSMQVDPTVGLLHQDVQRLVAKLAHLPYRRFAPATVQTDMGRLIPEATRLLVDFAPGQPVDDPADSVCAPIRDYGIPWMRAHASLQAIDELIVSGSYTVGMIYFKQPVISWLLGQPDVARQRLQARLSRPLQVLAESSHPDQLDPYERFAIALDEHMRRGTSPAPQDARKVQVR